MCIIFISYRYHSEIPFILLDNRDEYFTRPTIKAGYWEDNPKIYASKDLKGNGSWMGMNKNGRIAALTNYRVKIAASSDSISDNMDKLSRGKIISEILSSEESIKDILERLDEKKDEYNGFNLIVVDLKSFKEYRNDEDEELEVDEEVYYYSNRYRDEEKGTSIIKLEPGKIYGLSNHLLDIVEEEGREWPKVTMGKNLMKEYEGITREDCFELMKTDYKFTIEELEPQNYLLPDEQWEIHCGSIFVDHRHHDNDYGTRTTTVIYVEKIPSNNDNENDDKKLKITYDEENYEINQDEDKIEGNKTTNIIEI